MSVHRKNTQSHALKRQQSTQVLSVGVAELLVRRTQVSQRAVRPAGFKSTLLSLDVSDAMPPQEAALHVLRAKHGGRKVQQWMRDSAIKKYSVLAGYQQQFRGANPFAHLDAVLVGDRTFVAKRQDARVLRLNAVEWAAVREACPEFTIEQVRPVFPAQAFGRSSYQPIVRTAAAGETFEVLVQDAEGNPVAGAEVSASPDGRRAYRADTNSAGIARFSVAKSHTTFTLVVKPKAGYWTLEVANTVRQPQVVLVVSPLVPAAHWWRTLLHVPATLTGSGVKVGVVDSGVHHAALTVNGGKSFLESGQTSLHDGYGHGTHCAGIIAARPDGGWDGGLAPNVELYVYRVFDDDGLGGDTDVVAEAIRQAVDDGCQVINLSLTSDGYSEGLHNAVKRAADAGVLCVAASGNNFPDHQDIMYPAKHPEVASVGALGKVESYPADYPGGRTASGSQPAGTIYTADFSCRGQTLKFAAPGVAVISTVPLGYLAEDGTSMAAPMVTGLAALVLEQQPALLQMPPDRSRTEALIQALVALSVDVGLPRDEQGHGCPLFP